MSLRKALASLPDDRNTVASLREVVGYLHEHRSQPVDASRVARVTGVPEITVTSVLSVLVRAHVIDCDGDPRDHQCTYRPDTVLALEVERFLRSAGDSSARLQRGVDRFRNRYDAGH